MAFSPAMGLGSALKSGFFALVVTSSMLAIALTGVVGGDVDRIDAIDDRLGGHLHFTGIRIAALTNSPPNFSVALSPSPSGHAVGFRRHRRSILFAPVTSMRSLICSSTGLLSDAGDVLRHETASAESVTALKTTGVLDWAKDLGERLSGRSAIPTATETLSLLNFWAIEEAVEMSPFAFCLSKETERPCGKIVDHSCSAASRAGWAISLLIPRYIQLGGFIALSCGK